MRSSTHWNERPLVQLVLTISTEQPVRCAMLFETLPRMRAAPRIPLLPMTMRSALISSATCKIAAAGISGQGVGLDWQGRRQRHRLEEALGVSSIVAARMRVGLESRYEMQICAQLRRKIDPVARGLLRALGLRHSDEDSFVQSVLLQMQGWVVKS